jgi:hypothetical protein
LVPARVCWWHDGGTRATYLSTFESAEALQQVLDMGVVKGASSAIALLPVNRRRTGTAPNHLSARTPSSIGRFRRGRPPTGGPCPVLSVHERSGVTVSVDNLLAEFEANAGHLVAPPA